MASVWFEGVEELNTVAVELATSGLRVGAAAQTVVAKTAHDVEGTGKQFCPVDTGNLRNSIGTDIGLLQAAIGPSADYGRYVEFGTSRMAPHAYMGPALDRHAAEFETALGIAAERATLK
jgi:HK97 gp10 family phage protein